MIKGFTCGVFDIFHPGHVLMLEECKKKCNLLTVALNTGTEYDYNINPGKRKPIYTIEERILMLSSCKYVDEVLIYRNEEELISILRKNKYHIRFLGDDYIGKIITGPELTSEISFIDRSHGHSTSALIKKIKFA
jgi:glycerol-3-phosphate cytidylyltransferase